MQLGFPIKLSVTKPLSKDNWRLRNWFIWINWSFPIRGEFIHVQHLDLFPICSHYIITRNCAFEICHLHNIAIWGLACTVAQWTNPLPCGASIQYGHQSQFWALHFWSASLQLPGKAADEGQISWDSTTTWEFLKKLLALSFGSVQLWSSLPLESEPAEKSSLYVSPCVSVKYAFG